jgi:hypothetical protein
MQTLAARRESRLWTRAKTYLLALPLAAALITGCGDTENECRMHNETTITLNRQSDGKTASVKELEAIPKGSFLLDPQIDFINEAHAISSEGMPSDVKATRVAAECAVEDPARPKTGYTQYLSSDGKERGIYIPENPDSNAFHLINLMNHEIGHLQLDNPPHGFEVVSQLNEYEKQFLGYAVLASQEDPGLTRWQSNMVHPSLFRRLALALESGTGGFDAYDRANMLIFSMLDGYEGDFRAIRAKIAELVSNNEVDAALDAAVSQFQMGYSSNPDLFISIRMQIVKELERQFGLGKGYMDANSRLLDAAFVYGLDGLNCAYNAQPEADTFVACSDPECVAVGANGRVSVDYSLCCLGMDDSGFTKWSVEAKGMKYRNDGGKITSDGFDWDTVTYLTPVKTAIGMDDPCG